MPKRAPMSRRIMEKTFVSPSGCWIWTGAKKPTGYGNIKFGDKVIGAHVASFLTFVGHVPEGHYVCHSCDMPSCVNPAHLFVGTPEVNQRDSIAKGRKTKRGPDAGKRKVRSDKGKLRPNWLLSSRV